jgi:poly(A) polymerase
VAFASDIADDASRRDFTMNALYALSDGTVIDPLSGLEDLLARRLRFVGNAEARIREDYLRILRFFRFQAHFGNPELGLDADALAACALLADGLTNLSRERVSAEICKTLAAPDPAPAVASMAASGILARVLPGADPSALALLVHFEADTPPRWQRRLALIGGEDLPAALRLSKAAARDVSTIRNGLGTMTSPAELGYRTGHQLATDVILARAALFETDPPQNWSADIARGDGARMPVRAADLADKFSGPALGAALRRIEDRWITSDFTLTKVALLD